MGKTFGHLNGRSRSYKSPHSRTWRKRKDVNSHHSQRTEDRSVLTEAVKSLEFEQIETSAIRKEPSVSSNSLWIKAPLQNKLIGITFNRKRNLPTSTRTVEEQSFLKGSDDNEVNTRSVHFKRKDVRNEALLLQEEQ